MARNDVFVITGGAGGMGVASSRRLAARGSILLLDVVEQQLDEAARALRADGAQVEAMICDVTKPSDVAAVADRVRAIGRFRALVHTAGLSPVMAEARRILDVDLRGTVRMVEALSPLIEPGSCAVLIASIAGYADFAPEVESLLDDVDSEWDALEEALGRSIDSGTAYSLAKRGVIRLAERVAADWGSRGGRAVSISPGLIDTPMGRLEYERQPVMAMMAEATPIKRTGQLLPGMADDIAAAVDFLSSEQAAFISGCDIRVDGGLIGAGRHSRVSAIS